MDNPLTARNLRIDLDYDGTDFRGFVPQPGLRTVGGELQRVLERVLGSPTRVIPAGRTDSGVHARGQVVSFRTESDIGLDELKGALNALVGQDVVVHEVSEVAREFDARKSAKSRRYGYAIWNATSRNLWERRWSAHVDAPLDPEAMDQACRPLVGLHDFAAFRTHRTQDDPRRRTMREVYCAHWRRDESDPRMLRFEIEADGFLRHMVRTIVGSAVQVGLGKLPASGILGMLERGERAGAGPTAPANGLALIGVTY